MRSPFRVFSARATCNPHAGTIRRELKKKILQTGPVARRRERERERERENTKRRRGYNAETGAVICTLKVDNVFGGREMAELDVSEEEEEEEEEVDETIGGRTTQRRRSISDSAPAA